MNKIGRLMFAAAAVIVAGRNVTLVHAYPPFKTEFENLYVKENPTTPAEKNLKDAVDAKQCGVCHPNAKDKKVRNNYGKAIKELVPKGLDKAGLQALKKNAVKIKQILQDAAKEKSDPTDPKSPTFADLIKEGKLPGK